MTSNMQGIQPGWNVYGSEGDKLGEVSDVGTNYITVSKGWLFTTDIYIPVSAIASIEQDGIFLNIPKDQVERMGWDTPPLAEASTTGYDTTATSTSYTTTGTVDQDTAYADRDTAYVDRDVADTETTGTRVDRDLQGTTQPTDEVVIPVAEEELRVGTREVDRGGVRVNVDVEETPVEEQVNLREETVRVERRAVDRPVSDADAATFQEGTFEVRETDEEAIVDKQARVVEEVVIEKDVEERTETIQDTVRRTGVDVQEISGRTTGTEYRSGTTAGTEYRDTDVTSQEGTTGQGRSGLTDRIEDATGLDIDRDSDVGGRPKNR